MHFTGNFISYDTRKTVADILKFKKLTESEINIQEDPIKLIESTFRTYRDGEEEHISRDLTVKNEN